MGDYPDQPLGPPGPGGAGQPQVPRHRLVQHRVVGNQHPVGRVDERADLVPQDIRGRLEPVAQPIIRRDGSPLSISKKRMLTVSRFLLGYG